jgi:hypothetical protein
MEIARTVGTIARAIEFAWCLVFLLIASCTGILGLKWHAEGMAVAAGFAFLDAAGTTVLWLMNLLGVGYARVLSNLNLFACVAALIVWALVFRRPKPSRIDDEELIAGICEQAERLEESYHVVTRRSRAL